MSEKQKKTILRICSAYLAICLLICPVMTGCGGSGGETAETAAPETETVEIPAENGPKELSLTELMKAVTSVKDDLKSVLDSINADDLHSAETVLEDLEANTQMIRTSLDATIQNLGDSAPSLQKELKNVQEILNLVDLVSEKLLKPTIAQLRACPMEESVVGEGISTYWLVEYLDFAETRLPDVEQILQKAKTVDLDMLDEDGEIGGYLETADELMAVYRENPEVLSRMKTFLGAEGDRLYLIAVQNSAEIRASGGFPGSVGTIRIQDGILKLEKFQSVYNVLSLGVPAGVWLTYEEQRLFNYMSGMNAPRDADLCPDFERVGAIWAAGYEMKNKEPLSGVISMTPHIVQRLLAATDSEFELIGGAVLNGGNAIRVLQYDIYFDYYGKTTLGKGYHPDKLFDDAARKTMETLMENLSVSHLLGYLSVAKESIGDRTLMMWMHDEAEQAFVSSMGWDGSLNKDPEEPRAGVYFNCTVPSKQGIFLDIGTQMGEQIPNDDGSYSYPVTVTFSNRMTESERENATYYITGGIDNIQGAAYFFAPAGGTVGDFAVSNGLQIAQETYGQWELGFLRWVKITPEEPVTVTYTVTTAPGVETPPEFSKTPTLQGFLG